MTFAPASLLNLQTYWREQGGVSLGIVGNAAHTSGYHLGKDRIYDGSGPGLGDNDYSVKLARDKVGLTNAASAIDLGRLDGSYGKLRHFSRWLVAELQQSAAKRHDFREVIYSPDGVKVQRYSAIDNAIHTGPGNGDSSHLTHTHISYLRDSQGRDKVVVFRPYFPEVTPMPAFRTYSVPKYVTIPDKGWLYVNPDLSANAGNVQISPGPRDMPLAGKLADGTLIVGYVDATPGEVELPTYYVKGTARDYQVVSDCADAIATATATLEANLATCRLEVETAHAEGARQEWDRQAAGASVVVELLPRP